MAGEKLVELQGRQGEALELAGGAFTSQAVSELTEQLVGGAIDRVGVDYPELQARLAEFKGVVEAGLTELVAAEGQVARVVSAWWQAYGEEAQEKLAEIKAGIASLKNDREEAIGQRAAIKRQLGRITATQAADTQTNSEAWQRLGYVLISEVMGRKRLADWWLVRPKEKRREQLRLSRREIDEQIERQNREFTRWKNFRPELDEVRAKVVGHLIPWLADKHPEQDFMFAFVFGDDDQVEEYVEAVRARIMASPSSDEFVEYLAWLVGSGKYELKESTFEAIDLGDADKFLDMVAWLVDQGEGEAAERMCDAWGEERFGEVLAEVAQSFEEKFRDGVLSQEIADGLVEFYGKYLLATWALYGVYEARDDLSIQAPFWRKSRQDGEVEGVDSEPERSVALKMFALEEVEDGQRQEREMFGVQIVLPGDRGVVDGDLFVAEEVNIDALVESLQFSDNGLTEFEQQHYTKALIRAVKRFQSDPIMALRDSQFRLSVPIPVGRELATHRIYAGGPNRLLARIEIKPGEPVVVMRLLGAGKKKVVEGKRKGGSRVRVKVQW